MVVVLVITKEQAEIGRHENIFDGFYTFKKSHIRALRPNARVGFVIDPTSRHDEVFRSPRYVRFLTSKGIISNENDVQILTILGFKMLVLMANFTEYMFRLMKLV